MKKVDKYKKILVTGGAGFIGSHLVDSLIKLKYKVAIVDDLSSGNISNINKKASFYKASTVDYDEMVRIFKKEKPEVVYHLAANTNTSLSVDNPLYDFHQTLLGSVNIINICKENKVKKIIYISTGFIYGNAVYRPTKEDELPVLTSPYGLSKKVVEDYLFLYNKIYSLPFVVIRLSTVYGPRQTKGAMTDYINKLSEGKQAVFYGDGSLTRDYLFVDDLINALIKLLGLSKNFINPVFNVGTSKETSLKELYFNIAKALNKKPDPIYAPSRVGDLQFFSLDSSKLKKVINWKHEYDLEKGLNLTLKFRKLI